MGKKSKKKKSGIISRVKATFVLALLLLAIPGINWILQSAHKPTELIGLFDEYFYKSPTKTWSSYESTFNENATSIMSSHLLAAIAQQESRGNPIARTYWKFKWTTDIAKMYTPASTSVGLFQTTNGTFDKAKDFCIHNGKVARRGKWFNVRSCWFNSLYTRIIPSHSIEMTSALLDHEVRKILKRYKRKTSIRNKQRLAAIIHLCGPKAGGRFVASGFNPKRAGKCGSHSAPKYLRQVFALKKAFQRIDLRD